MDLSPYVDRLREELAVSAGGSPEAREVAERLARSLDSAARLMLFEVLADAAAEITSSLPNGSVTARLAGRGVDFVIEATLPQPDAPMGAAPVAEPVQDAEGRDLARITVRIPEGIKNLAEQQAAALELSLNAWIVKTLRQATSNAPTRADAHHGPTFDTNFPHGRAGRGRMSGWI